MALQVGTLFSKLEIRTEGAEQALGQHHRALQQTAQQAGQTEQAVASIGQVIAGAGRQAQAAAAQFEGVTVRAGRFEVAVDDLSADVKALNPELLKQARALADSGKEAGDAAGKVGTMGKSVEQAGKQAGSAGNIFQRLGQTISGAVGRILSIGNTMRGTGQNADGMARGVQSGSRSLRDMASASQQTEGALSRVGSMMSNIISVAVGFVTAQVAMRVFGAAASFVRESFIGMNDLLEQSSIAFTTMLGSAEAADKFLQELADFAEATPFDFPGLVQAAQRMMALGFSSQEVLPLLEDVGNVAAGYNAGADGLDRMTLALGQMVAKGKVQTQELLQLTEVGVPAFELLAEAIGVSTGEVQDLVSAGEISADVFLRIFHEWAQARFGDMMAKQSQTFTGAMSNISDSLTRAVAEGLQPFFNALRDGALRLVEFLDTDQFRSWVSALQQASQAAVDAILSIPGTARAFRDWVTAVVADGDILNDFLTGLPAWFQTALGRIQDMMGIGGHNAIVAYAQGIVDGASTYVTQAINYVADLIASYLVGQSPPPEGPLSEIDDAGRNLMETYTDGMVEGAKGAEDAAGRVADALDLVDERAQLDAGRAGLEAATGNLEQMEAVSADVEQKIKDIQREIAQIDLELLEIDRTTADINAKYDEQLKPLNEQLRLLEKQRDLQAEKLQLETDLARTQAQAAALAALGDPERRAEIAGEMALNDLQQQRLDNEQKIADVKAQLEGGGEELTAAERERLELRERDLELQRKETQAKLNGDKELTKLEKERLKLKLDQIDADLRANRAQQNAEPEELTEAERQRLELQLRELELRGELLAMIDAEAAAQAEADTALIDARQKEKDLIGEIADIQNEIAKIPILEEIEKVEEARRAELEPLEAQRALLEEQKEDLNYLRQHWQFLKGDVDAALEPLREAARLQEQMAKDAERQAKELERAAKAAAKQSRPDNSFEASQARLRGEDSCPPGWVMDAHGRCFNPEEEAWKQGIKDSEAGAGGLTMPELPTWSEMFPEADELEIPVTVVPGADGDNLTLDMLKPEPESLGAKFGKLFADGALGRIGELIKENLGRIIGASIGGALGGAAFGPAGAAIGGLLGGLIGKGLQEALADRGIDLDVIKGRLARTFEEDIRPVLETVAGFVQETVIPAFETFAGILQDHVVPIAERFFGFLDEHKDTILLVAEGIAVAVATFVAITATIAGVAAAVAGVTAIIGGIAALLNPVTLIIIGIAAAVAALWLAWRNNWGDIQGKTKAVWDFIRPILESIVERFMRFARLIWPEMKEAWGNIQTAITTTVGFIWNSVIKPTFDAISGFLSTHGDTIMRYLNFAWEYISNVIDTTLGMISNSIQFVLNLIQGDWEGAWENVKEYFRIVWDGILEMLRLVGVAIQTFIEEALPIIVEKLGQWAGAFLGWIANDVLPFIVEKLGAISTALLNWITDTALPWIKDRLKAWGAAFIGWIAEQVLGEDGLVSKLGGVARAILDWIGDKSSGATKTIKTKLGEFASAFVDWIKEKVLGTGEGSLVDTLGGILSAISGWITDKLQTIKDYGADIGDAIADGLKSAIKTGINAIIDIINGFIETYNGLSFDVPEVEIAGRSIGGQTIGVPEIPTIPKLQRGGLTTGNTLAMLHDNEVVLPLGTHGVRALAAALTEAMQSMRINVPRVSSQMAIPAVVGGSQFSSGGAREIVIHNHTHQTLELDGEVIDRRTITTINRHAERTY